VEDVKAARGFLTLVIKGEEVEQAATVSAAVHQFLEEFRDLTPVKLLNGLPPMRNIQHLIDLVPGASLPNLPYYHMSPNDHQILHNQVEDQIHKGLLRACRIPALLRPKKDGT
jgi:hypothetical protein